MKSNTAPAFVDSYNAIAQDWAATQGGRNLAAVPPVRGVRYQRIWPNDASLEMLDRMECEASQAWNGWLDSSLDLQDGLSVIEVYADPDPADVPRFTLELRPAF